ncbi:MAG: hypothetical protein K0R37_321 [Arthrobacter sp.]|jgi:Rrf2 family nitric oxide-sensitive transcriptional repressor|nr:hypothetical protein [Arthrobacter sp.]
MQLTRFTDYSLRVLMYLAHKGEALSTIAEVSTSHAISESHLTKVVHHLGKLGYVTTLRGKGGGIRLARAPQEINLGEVIRATEESPSIMECLSPGYGEGCRIFNVCRLKHVLRDAETAFFRHLDGYTIADLVPPATVKLPYARPGGGDLIPTVP